MKSFDTSELPQINQKPRIETRYKAEITDELYHSSLMDLTEDEQEHKLRNIKEKIKVHKSNRTSKKLAKINYNYGSQNFRIKGPKISVRNS